jgi:stage II sporulation protein P
MNKNVFNNPVNILHTNNNNITLVSNISYIDNKPKVYIYNSHQGELYTNKYMENSNITPNVMLASTMLQEKLESLGIKTIVEKNDILKYMSDNGLNHGGSYIASRYFLNKVYEKYPNLDLYIDLHRDATSYDIVHTSIDGKDYARVLFVIGLENHKYQSNLDITNKLNNIILSTYPDLTRGIMKKEGPGVNGVYNQDLNSNVILIEIGGDKNNIDEVNNTLDIIAKVIERYINEKEKI